ncbi:MCE family protein [Solicola sp. PLA-1-18]|uniref:MCE family protein n=1 Tax=Solicola sp. PLA-1-18 TaxID=3380532 RepID=UPI003B819CEB
MKPFRERNPAVIGLVSLSIIALMILGAFRADRLPVIGGGDTYFAEFSEAGGLKSGNEVRLAGVSVGKVKDITLDGDRVKVELLLDKGVRFGEQSGAEIRVRTLLGAMFVAITPDGSGQLPVDSVIPVERTVAPYDVVQAFSGLSETTDRIDTQQLATALDTISEVANGSPEEFKGTVAGVSALSRKIAARDQQINTLLQNLEKVSGVLASRNTELAKLFRDGDVLFRAVAARREQIHDLLVGTQELSRQLRGVIADTKADLNPALKNLDGVVQVLRKNQDSLDRSLQVSGDFYRLFGNTLANGPFFDSYVFLPPQLDLGLTDQLKGVIGNVTGGATGGTGGTGGTPGTTAPTVPGLPPLTGGGS